MPKVGGKRRKTRTQADGAPKGAVVASEVGTIKEDSTTVVPKTIVARGSKVIPLISELVRDLRKVMAPNTTTNLREKNFNRMKDYISVAGLLGISHLLVVSQTKSNIVLRIGKMENGPTLHFHVEKYCLARHIRASQKKPHDSSSAYLTSPLVVLNNFGKTEDSHVKLMSVTLQHMFPSINVKTIRLNECRRVVLFHYMKDTGLVEMRHYYIRAAPVGISRSVKKILQASIPDLGKLQDISEFIEGQGLGAASDSEAEDESSRVILPEKFIGRGNAQSQQSSIKLSEVGPRMTLDLFKVERGLCEGDILYHKYESKSAEEAAQTKRKVEKGKMLKQERRAVQEANVKRKRAEEEEKLQAKKQKKMERIEGAGGKADTGEDADADAEDESEEEFDEDDLDDDDDAEDVEGNDYDEGDD